jgi:lysozyme
MRLETVRNDLMVHEGFRSEAYQDHLGYWTIGYGRLVDDRRGGGITQDEARMLLDNDIAKAYNALSRELPYFEGLPSQVQRGLINMAFQLGINGLLNFKKMLGHIKTGDYSNAAKEALRSKWAEQTPNRAAEVTEWIRWAA